MTENPMDKVAKLARRVADDAKDEGLVMFRFNGVPNLDNGPHHAEIIFMLDDEYVPKVESEYDDELEAIMRATEEQEQAEKAEKARKGLEELSQQLRRPEDGIL